MAHLDICPGDARPEVGKTYALMREYVPRRNNGECKEMDI